MSPRRSPLSRFERDAYLASRTAGDLHAAGEGPGALAERVARRQVRRRLYAAGAPLVPLPRGGRRNPATAARAPRMGPLGALTVLLGLVVLVAGLIGCAVSGNWAAMLLVLPIGLGLMLFAGRGGRDGIRR